MLKLKITYILFFIVTVAIILIFTHFNIKTTPIQPLQLSPSSNPTSPSGVIYSVPIIINNAQNTQTSAGFQQELIIYLNKSYLGSGLKNVEFFYANGTLIPSWMQSYNNTGLGSYYSIIYWLKLMPQIPANGNLTVYLGVGNTSANFFNKQTTGEAPQLSAIYGEYDNGFNIFNLYDNFIGTSLNTSKWSSCYGYTVDNGYTANTANCSSSYAQMPTPKAVVGSPQNPPTGIVSMYVSNSHGPGSGIPVVCWLHTGGYCNPSSGLGNGAIQLYSGIPGTDSNFYGIDISTSNSLSAYQVYTINWMFISDYPPNGIMPNYIVSSSPIVALNNISLLSGWSGGSYGFPSPVPVGPQVYSNGSITAVLTNYGISVYTNSGSYVGSLPSSSLGWNGYGINPQFYYDSSINRWIVITDGDPNVNIGISKTGNILGSWYNYSIPEKGDSDYTQMAVSKNNLVITADIFTIGGGYFVNSTIFVVNKTMLINNNRLSFSKTVFNTFLFPQPLTPINNNIKSIYVITAVDGSASSKILNISGSAENPTIQTIYFNSSRHPLEVFGNNFSDGPTGSNTIQATGGQGGIVYKGNAWYGFDTTCNTHLTQCIHVMEINLSSGNLIQQFNIQNNTYMNFINPSFTVNNNGDLAITFEYGNSTNYGSLGTAVQLSNAQPNTISYFIPLKQGVENVGGRYGDWSGSSASPNGKIIYSAGQYAGNFKTSSLWIQSFSINYNTQILTTTTTIPTTSTTILTTTTTIPTTTTTIPSTTVNLGGNGGSSGGGGIPARTVIPNIDINGKNNTNVILIYNNSPVKISAYNKSNPYGIVELTVNQVLVNYSGSLSFGSDEINYTMEKRIGTYKITALSVSGNARTELLKITNNSTLLNNSYKNLTIQNSTLNYNYTRQKINQSLITKSNAILGNNSTVSVKTIIKNNTITEIDSSGLSVDIYPYNPIRTSNLTLILNNTTDNFNIAPMGYSKIFIINITLSKYNGDMGIIVNKTINCNLINYTIFEYQYSIWYQIPNYNRTENNGICTISFPYNGTVSGIFAQSISINSTTIPFKKNQNSSVGKITTVSSGSNQLIDYIYDIIIFWLIIFILYETNIIIKNRK